MFRKNKLAMLVGEFLGTAVLTLSVLAISRSQLPYEYFVALGMGLAMVILTIALGGISGAVFNPAMTIGLWTVRKLRTLQAITYLAAQLLGGAAAYALFVYFTKLHDVNNNSHYEARTLVAEVVGTFIFAFAWAGGLYQRLTITSQAAVRGIGLAVGAFSASLASIGLLNPAVALGFRNWSWTTYVLGPVLGAIIGFNLYNLLFVETEIAEVEEAVEEAAALEAVAVATAAADTAAAQKTVATRRASTARKSSPPRKSTARKSTGTRSRSSSSSSRRRSTSR